MNGWMLLEIVVNIFQGWLIVYAVKKLLVPVRVNWATDCACIAAIAGWYTMYLFWDISILDTVVFIFPFLYACLTCKDKWYFCLYWNIVLSTVFTVCTTLNISFYLEVLGAKLEEIMTQSSLRVAFLVSVNLTLLIAVLLMVKVCKRNEAPPWGILVPLFILNFMSLLSVEFLFAMRPSVDLGGPFVYTCLCLFGVSALSIVLFEACARSARKQRQYELDIERLNMTQRHNREMESIYADMATFRHDMKHQMQVIAQMLSDQGASHLQQYIAQLQEHAQALQPFATGNQAVDALLTAKTSIMRRQHIELAFCPYPLDDLPICESDFCSVLGNLLDNAVEGIERIEGQDVRRVVTLSFARAWDMFYIVCKNPCDMATVRRVYGSFLSSRQRAREGIGTRSIQTIARNAKGDADFRVSESTFTAKVTLPFLTE